MHQHRSPTHQCVAANVMDAAERWATALDAAPVVEEPACVAAARAMLTTEAEARRAAAEAAAARGAERNCLALAEAYSRGFLRRRTLHAQLAAERAGSCRASLHHGTPRRC